MAHVCAAVNTMGRTEAEVAALESDPALELLDHFETADEWLAHVCTVLNLVGLTDADWARAKVPPPLAFVRYITPPELRRIRRELARAMERLRHREAEPRGAAGHTEKFGGGPGGNVLGPTRSPTKG